MKKRFDLDEWVMHVNNLESFEKDSPESLQAVEYFSNYAREVSNEVVRLSFCLYKCHSFLQNLSTSLNDKFSYFFNSISQNSEIPSINALGHVSEAGKKNLNEFKDFLNNSKTSTRKK